ncbi:DUF2752 domain-containing protein [Brachyspira hampsonii]|uniref:DUF2752 domain-containing protein n=1 Tax=Brachyspira hampsonii 30446 TaxID=1289135 RepID=A0A2U4FP85_9SPIR|nr:DUF2752 domain-containing protein [Brachyspira hampsonii]EKV56953.1 hypothetical protein A966_07939 [Brachyspira hampsonii 30446]MBW5389433.1 DUF2752 domain-containing protein [Brachyspira hampsonii]MBW5393890.1 DUF2752 domain-containing protein [Brachyspira hampsonii]OEJ15612.1 hypothetical protein A9495_09415 [Brachyspira hampsonii]
MIKILKLILIFFTAFFIVSDSNKYSNIYSIPIDELCMIRNVTGFPCPGCGMTRAHIEIFKLDFKKAFYYHPLFIFPSIIFFAVIFRKRFKIANYIYHNNYIIISILIIFIIVYIIRFVLLFPNEEPFTYNYDSIFYKLLTIIKNILK